MKLELASFTIQNSLPALIMGIVNCTDDSFYAGARGGADLALRLIDEGADIIDIGGESTRPGASYIEDSLQIERIVPVIKEIRKRSSIPISVDTRKKAVIEAAIAEGANILNDVSALEDDSAIAGFIAEKNVPVILMHKRGTPSSMQEDTVYSDIFTEVDAYLNNRASYAIEKGVKAENIIMDPGIGFGKDLKGNKTLIANCGHLCGGRYNILIGLSRKTCIGEMTGQKDVSDRLFGTLAANMIAVKAGASVLRVHDVLPCKDSLLVMKEFLEAEHEF